MDKSKAIAEIALKLSENPTTAEILSALTHAYNVGFAQGAVKGTDHMARTLDLVLGKL